MSEQGRIVVGIDGTHAGETALRYAEREAVRRDLALRLVHVAPDLTRIVGSYAITYQVPTEESDEVGRRILENAAEPVRERLGTERVTVSLLHGNRVACLVDEADQAVLTVLGDQPRPIIDRLVTGTVLTGVAARSVAPVVAVPDNWSPETEHGELVVAVKDCETSGGLVRRALETAGARGHRLVVLHAWQLPTAYDDLIALRVDAEVWRTDLEAILQRAVDEQRAAVPEVEVEIRVVHGPPAQALVAASAEADLMVVARRQRWFPIGHLGGTGRTVLRASLCPVAVLPPVA